MLISKVENVRGELEMPGDKSISHRAAILAALAEGWTTIENFAPGADCGSTLDCLRSLGVAIEHEGNRVVIDGRGLRGVTAPSAALDCGNSGTTMRLLAGVLAGQNFESELSGDESLSKRPMSRVIDPLSQMGARIDSNDGKPPLRIYGGGVLKPIEYGMPVASAQVKSCVLLAGLFAKGTTRVIEHVFTRDHTERLLPEFGVDVETVDLGEETRVSVEGGKPLIAVDLIQIPGDVSSAAFFAAAAAAMPGSRLSIRNVGINAARRAFPDVLRVFGADVDVTETGVWGGEPVGTITVSGGRMKSSTVINSRLIAGLIDELPILAVLGTQIEGGVEIRDAGELRHKESDRISAAVDNLRRMGADVEEFPDGLRVSESPLFGAKVDSFGDHRIAMAFAVAGLFAEGETEIIGHECADISFPGFFDVLRSLSADG